MHTQRITFAANNGDIGGGEVMLLAMARAARAHGHDVEVVGPGHTDGVVSVAEADGFPVVHLAASRSAYMWDLRTWDRNRGGLLWCNGLVPALATAGHAGRIVHLHRQPQGIQHAAARLARLGTLATVVPSRYLAGQLHADHVLPNWTDPPAEAPVPTMTPSAGRCRVGYLGRWAQEKGLDVLLAALSSSAETQSIELVLAGEYRFTSAREAQTIATALAEARVPVTAIGWVTLGELAERVDALIVPSSGPESFGLVVAEAMAAKVPVIVTDAGALPEVVGPDHPWIARAGDAESLKATIERFLSQDSATREANVAAAHHRWIRLFSPEAGQARFQDLLSVVRTGMST